MKIQWLGHSAFRLIESTGTSITIDPFEASAVGFGMAYCTASAVTVSGNSPERNFLNAVKGKFVTIAEVGNFEVDGVHIRSILSKDKLGNDNLIFKYRLDGVEVCHLGCVGEYDEGLIEQLMPADILLLPCGGGNSLDPEEAKMFADRLMPGIVIPMHYKSKESDAELEKVEAFLKEFDGEEVTKASESTLEFERDDFDNFLSVGIIVPKRYRG